MVQPDRSVIKDGRAWPLGSNENVAWINNGVRPSRSISASVPPVFAAYATLTFLLDLHTSREQLRPADDRFDDAFLSVLSAHTAPQPWWLGFLDTGATDVVIDAAPRVQLYSDWNYVLVRAGPLQARTWRSEDGRWFTALPEQMFPVDRSWLVSSRWDDAWAGVGGSADLIAALLSDPELHDRGQRTDPSVPDVWPSCLPDEMHQRLLR